MNQYHHLTPQERAILMVELEAGISLRKIALRLNRHPSTLSRELRRNQASNTSYGATLANQDYVQRQQHSRKPRKLVANSALCDTVEHYLLTPLNYNKMRIEAQRH